MRIIVPCGSEICPPKVPTNDIIHVTISVVVNPVIITGNAFNTRRGRPIVKFSVMIDVAAGLMYMFAHQVCMKIVCTAVHDTDDDRCITGANGPRSVRQNFCQMPLIGIQRSLEDVCATR